MSNFSTLKKIICFKDMNDEEFDSFTAVLTPIEKKKGEVLFKEGDDSHDLYFVISGTVTAVKECGPGRVEKLANVSAPTIIGEISFLIGTLRGATIQTSEDTVLLKLTKANFQKMFDAGHPAIPRMLRFFSEVLSHRVHLLTDKVCGIIDKKAEQGKNSEMADLEKFRNKLFTQWSF